MMDADALQHREVRRVLVAGDTHGNIDWIKQLITAAATNDCQIIIQVGDFGYFPAFGDGRQFLAAANRACARAGVELWFIDGNHDDHDALRSLEHGHTPNLIADHVTYLPRGTRVHIGDRVVGFLGGAFSVDWRDRTLGRDWWLDEVTTATDIDRLSNDRLDILISHDAPAGVNLVSGWRLPPEDQVRADDVRALIARAVATTTPQLVLHGHWHHGHDTEMTWIDRASTERSGDLTWRSTRVIGLGCDGDTTHGWAIIDLPTLTVTWPGHNRRGPTTSTQSVGADSTVTRAAHPLSATEALGP